MEENKAEKRDPLKRILRKSSFVRFCVIGSSAYCIDVGLFTLLFNSILTDQKFFANAFSTSISLVYTFFMNKLWTFHDAEIYSVRLISKYVTKTVLYMLVSYFVLNGIIFISDWEPELCKLIVPSVMCVLNYFVDKYWVFKNK